MTRKPPKEHRFYTPCTLIALLPPLLGFVVDIALLQRKKQLDKRLGEHVFELSFVFLVVQPILTALFVIFLF